MISDRTRYQRIITDLQDERDALKMQIANRDALIADLRSQIDRVAAMLGEADSKTTAPKCPACKQGMIEDEFPNGERYWACINQHPAK